jgi:GT2 family glycosyltransferase
VDAYVWVLVLNYNSGPDTVRCVAALQRMNFPSFRVVVVDNCSTDNSVALFRAEYPDIEVLPLARNLGFAAGNNVGIQYAMTQEADYVLIVNPDMTVHKDALTYMVEACLSDPTIAAVSPIIRYADCPERIWFAGSCIQWAKALATHLVDEDVAPDKVTDTAWPCGGCMLLECNALRRVGAMDEHYFLYFEDADLGQRLLASHLRAVVCPRASALHNPHNSVRGGSPRHEYYMTRSYFRFFLLHGARHGVSGCRLWYRLCRRLVMNRRTFRGLVSRDPKAIARMLACFDFIRRKHGPSSRYSSS